VSFRGCGTGRLGTAAMREILCKQLEGGNRERRSGERSEALARLRGPPRRGRIPGGHSRYGHVGFERVELARAIRRIRDAGEGHSANLHGEPEEETVIWKSWRAEEAGASIALYNVFVSLGYRSAPQVCEGCSTGHAGEQRCFRRTDSAG